MSRNVPLFRVARVSLVAFWLLPGALYANAVVGFDKNVIDDQGLIGSSGGKRALSYEFCLPDRAMLIAAVQTIDPTLKIYANSPGRSDCHSDQVLCIGHTWQNDWRKVLDQLESVPAIQQIRQSFFE